MTHILPLFPLQLVVFPDEDLNLHIFEPRYQELIRDCEEEGITFGIPSFIGGKVMPLGTEICLQQVVKRYQSGESDIRTKGLGLFNIKEFHKKVPGKLYSGASIERIDLDNDELPLVSNEILEKTIELFQLLEIDKKLPDSGDGLSVFDIAHDVGLSIEQEYDLLCIKSAQERQKYLLDHLRRLIPVVRQMEEIREKAQMNGHFRRIVPPK